MTVLKADAVREVGRLGLVMQSLGDDLLQHGVLTGRGRTRAALSAYTAVLDRFTKLASMLGLERTAKSVSFAQAVTEAPVHE